MAKRVTDSEPVDPQCAARHLVPWAARPEFIAAAVQAWKAGQLLAGKAVVSADGERILYTVDDYGIATLNISGAMMRGRSKFGGTSTLDARKAVRLMKADADVKGVMLAISSPGGTVAGNDEFASDLRALGKVKPMHAYAEGEMCSAAYWCGIQASRVTASRTTDVGSIGVIAQVWDTSGQFEKDGIKVHVIATGEDKGAFADGVPVTEANLDYARELVADTFKTFKAEVMSRRNMTAEQFKAVSSGRVWLAPQAKDLGLIDAVATMDQAYNALRGEVAEIDREARKRERERAALRESLKSH
jgi:signal peptide peptidase SppA